MDPQRQLTADQFRAAITEGRFTRTPASGFGDLQDVCANPSIRRRTERGISDRKKIRDFFAGMFRINSRERKNQESLSDSGSAGPRLPMHVVFLRRSRDRDFQK